MATAAKYCAAAERGDPTAMFGLGWCFASGTGVVKDAAQAAAWYRKAADLGDASAMSNLGVCFERGTGVEKDEAHALAWYRKAADAGNTTAMCNLGMCYKLAKDADQAVAWYGKAADLGHAGAMANLAVWYGTGTDVVKDEVLAVEWYRKAADAGDAGAMFNLGGCCKTGMGVTKDEEQAAAWYRKAADLGQVDAMAALGRCYEIAKDIPEARRWFQAAADKGNEDGKEALARLNQASLSSSQSSASGRSARVCVTPTSASGGAVKAPVNAQPQAPAATPNAAMAAAAPPLPANCADWTVDHVCRWLISVDLGHVQRHFRENRIKGAVLGDLSADDLKDAGVTAVGDRKWFHREVRKLLANAPDAPGRPMEAAPAASAAAVPGSSRNTESRLIKLEDVDGPRRAKRIRVELEEGDGEVSGVERIE